MDHVAIMKTGWNMIPKILSGQKTIESRWYQAKRAPWGKIKTGDTVYFKNSGEMVTAKAIVSKVLQCTIADISEAEAIIKKYGKKICLPNDNFVVWHPVPKYCILIFLQNSTLVKKPFHINKKGFGMPAAWLTVENIRTIKI